eukprot:gene6905-4975_t
MEMVPVSLHKHHPQQGTSRQVMPISGVPPAMSIFSYPAKLFPVLPLLLQNQKVDVSETVYTVMDVYGQRHRMATLPLIKDIQVQEENRWIEPAAPPPDAGAAVAAVAAPPADAKRHADQAAEKKAPAKRHSKSEAKLRAAFDDFNSDDDSSSSDSDADVNGVDVDARPVRTKTNEKRTKRPSKTGAAVLPAAEPSQTNIVEDLEADEAETQIVEASMTTVAAAAAAVAASAEAAAKASNAEPPSQKDGAEPLRSSRKKSKRLRMSKSSVATSDSSLISWSSSSDSSSESSRGERDREHDHDSDMDKASDKEDVSPESHTTAALESKDDEEQQCIVCLSDTREVILFPCRHLNTCLPCAKMLIASRNQCPICRSTAEAIIHIVAFHEASPDEKAQAS